MNQPASRPDPQNDPQRRNWQWWTLQVVCHWVFRVWLRFRARGIENLPPAGALLLINHQSYLDPLLVGAPLTRPVSFLARDSLFRVPIVGWILRATHVIPIRRESTGTESIRSALARLDQGFLVGIFPEGTRTPDGSLGEMKPGFLALVRRVKVPVVPVAVVGAFEAFPRGAWFVWPGRIRVVYGTPISPETIAELSAKGREQEFVQLVRNRISECMASAQCWRNGTT